MAGPLRAPAVALSDSSRPSRVSEVAHVCSVRSGRRSTRSEQAMGGGGPEVNGDRDGRRAVLTGPQGAGATASAERHVLSLLSRGRFADTRTALQVWAQTAWFRMVAEADMSARLQTVDISHLQSLRTRTYGHQPELGWWVDAVICEHLLGQLDGAGAELAETILEGVPVEPLPSPMVLYARGRLRRATSAGPLFNPSGVKGIERGRRLRDEAVGDLLRGGFAEEAVLTQALGAAAEVLMLGADPDDNQRRLLDALAVLGDQRSAWVSWVEHLLVLVAAVRGDRATASQALDRTRSPAAHAVPAGPLSQFVAAVAAALDLPDDGAVGALDEVVRETGLDMPRWRWRIQLAAAHWLALEDHAEADRFAPSALAAPSLGPGDEVSRRLHEMRFQIRAGDMPAPDLVADLLAQLHGMGMPAMADWFAGLLGDELARYRVTGTDSERAALASILRRHRAPAADADHDPEAAVADSDPSPRSPRVAVNVMCPALEVEVGGTPVALTENAARLVVHLAVVAPQPLHTEQVAEALWPGLPLHQARQRLNGLVHRLRKRHPAVADVIVREGDLLRLSPGRGCEIDLVEYQDACSSGGDARLSALGRVRANLCGTQFPYDERLVEARHYFAARWSAHVREACPQGRLPPALATAAAVLGIDSDR